MYINNLTTSLLFVVYILTAISCSGNSKKTGKEDIQQKASLMEVSIEGMTCTGCEQTIQRNIGNLEGIKSVKASFTVGNAIIEYFPEKVDTLKIKEAITGSGYTVKKFITFQPGEAEK